MDRHTIRQEYRTTAKAGGAGSASAETHGVCSMLDTRENMPENAGSCSGMTTPEPQCEFCAAPAKWCFWRGEYERFGCVRHLAWLRRLVYLDLAGPDGTFRTYTFSPCGSEPGRETCT